MEAHDADRRLLIREMQVRIDDTSSNETCAINVLLARRERVMHVHWSLGSTCSWLIPMVARSLA